MKRDLYIELIADFMLARPGRPFEEVHIYAQEIGAGEDELKEAIFRVSKHLAERKIKAKRSGTLDTFEKFEEGMSIRDEEFFDEPDPSQVSSGSVKEDAEQSIAQMQEKMEKSLEGIVEAKLAEILTKKDGEFRNHDKEAAKPDTSGKLETISIETFKQKGPTDAAAKTGDEKEEKIIASVKKRRFSKLPSIKFPNVNARSRMLLLFFVAPVIIVASSLFLYQNTQNAGGPTKEVASEQDTQTKIDKPAISFGPPVVFASQEKMDAKRIFSFPQSNVSLDYSGLPKKEVFGFFPYWMLGVAPEVNIDVYSTIAIFGLTSDGKGNIITSSTTGTGDEGWNMWNSKELDQFIARAKKKRIKMVLTIKSFNNEDIESLVQSDEAQRKFISNAIQLVSLKDLDGVNIDFEYTGTPPEAATFGFTRLIANLNSELKRQVPEAHLSLDTYLKSGGQRDLFDVQLLQDYVDAIVVMGYDVHTPNGVPGPVSPMEGENGILGFMQSYLERVSPSKLILAVPYYGYDWPIVGPESAENSSRILSYAEIANNSTADSILWNEQTQTPYYQYKDFETGTPREVHFENARSLGVKYDYVKRKNLQGIGVWAMGYEGNTLELEQVILEKFAK